ncbi:potassium transporter TrkA [Pseudomonas alcaligenes]|uniref:Potassium transporter TrkA n=1 Tax=Aquipseudomonas alcaligenes TaxID=43263 RepID=A0ABR7RXG5_AQUAC|nr:potassium transporter TrkA [Pseudomonas alcaligenes]MBC9248913.1 potassium transporter TrkA [Pseudomonas alcaligenes]
MPHQSITWRDQLRYRFENTLSKGPIAIIGWLGLVSSLVVALATALLMLLHVSSDPSDPASQLGFAEGAWQSLMHAIDSGNLAGDQGWHLRALMLLVTLSGIFIVSILIGTITSGLEARLAELRKGRSRVIESQHTLILGWSSKVYSIIGELLIANENQKQPRIVILADRDKVEMEDDIRAKFPSTGNTRIICRRGDPLDLDDLEVVDPHSARSVIVLAPEIDNPDIYVIKSVLALTNNPNRKAEPYHIVAEIRHARNLEAAALVGGDEALFVQGEDLIARVTAQTCRQSGLSVVYTELLDFDGAEIYFKEEPALLGKTFREVLVAYEDSAVMGIMRADGEPLINPPMDTRMGQGDLVIAISEDDDTLVLAAEAPTTPDKRVIVQGARSEPQPERTLILGWNEKAAAIIRELDNYVAPGSEVVVVAQCEGAREEGQALAKRLQNQGLKFSASDITSRAVINALRVSEFNHIILLSYTHLPMQEADAKTLISLLHLRSIAEQSGKPLAIVSEMMDLRNRALAEVAKADDYIVSDKLVSLMLSQLSENKGLERVFRVLFSSEGSEIYIRPISDYVKPGVPVDFYTLIEAAAQRGETAIGYRRVALANDKEQGYGVKLNTLKREKITFEARDQIVVLAED